jgi:radical SAM protein with 4Fe4S-binding SPASM domain
MSVAMQAASLAKLTPSLFERPEFSLSATKLLISRLLLNIRVPPDGMGAGIRQVSLRLTDLCNLRCHTCGQWGDNGYLVGRPMPDLVRSQITPERYIELMEDLVQHGHRPGIYFWGGEPMLYRGLTELVEAAARLGLPTSIATNATKVADKAERLVNAPMFLVQVSIDGPDAETHNACRPGANSSNDNFATVVAGLDALKAERDRRGARLPVLAGLCTINALNADRLIDIYDAFADRLDVLIFYLAWWIDEEAAAEHTLDFVNRFGVMPTRHLGWIGGWRPTDYEGLSRQLTALARKGVMPKRPAVLVIPGVTGAKQLERYYTDHSATFGYNRCTSIYRAVEINSNGDMAPCRDYNDYIVGNVKTHTITELWNSAAYRRFRQSLSRDGLMPVCTRCCGLMGN